MEIDMLAGFYERDLTKLIEEINLFRDEENLWRKQGSVKNSCGNLVLHLVGGLNYLIGTQLAATGYVRNRDEEFSQKGIPRRELIARIEKLIPMILTTVTGMAGETDAEYPIPFDGMKRPASYVLVQLSLHLNYHLGQVNYLRRMLE